MLGEGSISKEWAKGTGKEKGIKERRWAAGHLPSSALVSLQIEPKADGQNVP